MNRPVVDGEGQVVSGSGQSVASPPAKIVDRNGNGNGLRQNSTELGISIYLLNQPGNGGTEPPGSVERC